MKICFYLKRMILLCVLGTHCSLMSAETATGLTADVKGAYKMRRENFAAYRGGFVGHSSQTIREILKEKGNVSTTRHAQDFERKIILKAAAASGYIHGNKEDLILPAHGIVDENSPLYKHFQILDLTQEYALGLRNNNENEDTLSQIAAYSGVEVLKLKEWFTEMRHEHRRKDRSNQLCLGETKFDGNEDSAWINFLSLTPLDDQLRAMPLKPYDNDRRASVPGRNTVGYNMVGGNNETNLGPVQEVINTVIAFEDDAESKTITRDDARYFFIYVAAALQNEQNVYIEKVEGNPGIEFDGDDFIAYVNIRDRNNREFAPIHLPKERLMRAYQIIKDNSFFPDDDSDDIKLSSSGDFVLK
ncbi:MAG: hypothetical protein V4482_00020 [Pseudomonadota bacterium]